MIPQLKKHYAIKSAQKNTLNTSITKKERYVHFCALFLENEFFLLLKMCVLWCTFWVFAARWCPETLKWAHLSNQLSVRDEPKNTFYRRRWPTDRAIFFGPRTPDKKSCRLLTQKSHPLFRSAAQQNMMSRYPLPRYQPAEWPSVMILRLVWTCFDLSVRFCLCCKTAPCSENEKMSSR